MATLSFGEFTVHILNPWANDSARAQAPLYIQSNEPGWYPGAAMTYDFGNWFMYTFKNSSTTANDRIDLMSVIPNSNDSYADKQLYQGGSSPVLIVDIFAGHEDETDVWLVISDSVQHPQVQFTSPPYKIVRFFKPWSLGGAYIDIKNTGVFKMTGIEDYCGWLTYKWLSDSTNMAIRFRNTVDSSLFGAGGPGDGAYFDLNAASAQNDTIWILAESDGIQPSVSSSFPGKLGDCNPIWLATTLRDIGSAHGGFGVDACNSGKIAYTGLVKNRLESNGKPVKVDGIYCTDQFDWFETEDLGNGYTNEQCYNLKLHKNDEGLYEYNDSAFFPLDSFFYLDDGGSVPNPNFSTIGSGDNNFFFTLETHAEFEYVTGQHFYFRGDDDIWVFIDSELVVDLGGVHFPIEGSVDLDTLGLIPGKTYSFSLFFTERNCCGSSFRMVTSINLRTSSKLYHTAAEVDPGKVQYDIHEKITQDNMMCDASAAVIDTIKASVSFYIEGPLFNEATALPLGSSYGGVTVLPDYSGIVIDEPSIAGLTPGPYTIHYYSTKDRSMEGFFIFLVTDRPRFNNSITNAAYFTDNGRGAVDRVEIYFTDTVGILPDSVLLGWPSIINSKVVVTGIIADSLDKRHLTVRLANPFPDAITKSSGATQLGRCYLNDSTQGAALLVTIPFSIADSIGPLIKSAVLIERTEPGNDTLFLTFSEALQDTALAAQSIVLIKERRRITLTSAHTFRRGDTTVFIIADLGADAPSQSDSVAISSIGPIRDSFGNRAHPDNRPVAFITRKIPGKVINAYYLDSDANGLVDHAVLQFNKPVLLSDFTAKFAGNLTPTAPLDATHSVYGADSTEVVIDLRGAVSAQTVLTSGAMWVNITQVMQEGGYTVPVADSAAPVLTAAVLHPGIAFNGNKPNDTLICTFSEPVADVPCTLPFLFSRSGSAPVAEYQMSLTVQKNTGSQWSFTVNDLRSVEYPLSGDSVWINDTCGISDTLSNQQLHHSNHRVALSIRTIPITYAIRIGPNPLRLSDHTGGTAIRIEPSVKQRQFVVYTVELMLFDAIGNVVLKTRRESRDEPSVNISFAWNGRNSKGRTVGIGSYLAVVTVFDVLRNRFERETFMIGVVR